MIYYSAEKRDLKELKQLLKEGYGIDERGGVWEMTALMSACSKDDNKLPSYEMAKFLIDNGAKVNLRSKQGHTALSRACEFGDLKIVKLLLDKGAKVNQKGDANRPPLVYAANCSRHSKDALKIVKLLLEKGAHINATDTFGNNALTLMTGTINYRFNIAKFLIDQGINIDHARKNKETALTEAAKQGHLDLVKYLVKKGADMDIKSDRKQTALLYAVNADNPDVVRYLLKQGADHKGKVAYSSLDLISYICRKGHADILDLLVKKRGLKLKRSKKYLGDLLTDAASNGHVEIVKRLHEAGADLNYKYFGTALMQASRYAQTEVAEYLIKNGADMEVENYEKNTAIHFAADSGSLGIIKLLVDNGADINHLNHLDWIPMMQACLKGRNEVVRYFIEKGCDVNHVEKEKGGTPLMIAASAGHVKVIKTLVEAGAELDAIAKNGRTAYTWALGEGYKDAAEALKMAGAKTEVKPEKKDVKMPKGAKPCAFCGNPVRSGFKTDNYCPECDAVYCDEHLPWSEWSHVHITCEDMIRGATCPRGHYQEQWEK